MIGGLLLAALGAATAGLNVVLADVMWWFQLMALAVLVLVAAAVARSFARSRWWGTVVAFLVAVGAVTFLFAPGSAILGVIPTFGTFGELHELELKGVASIASQEIPADVDQGILYLLSVGIVGIALAADTVAFSFRMPAAAGVPLLVMLLVPSFVRPAFNDGFFFTLAAAAYLGVLLVGARPGTRRTAATIGGVAVVLALFVPLAIPAVQPTTASDNGSSGVATGLNPIITLGDDLRQGDPTLALVYTTSAETGLYLRLTALDEFSGDSWEPSTVEMDPDNDIDEIGPVPGLGTSIPATSITTEITVANIASRWLPAPYAPQRITGLGGSWRWEPAGLTIRTERSNARQQTYTVISKQIAPTIEQLVVAGTTLESGLDRYLVVPEDLPPVVAETAAQVAGSGATFYEQAVALQSYFRSGDFAYSEEAPVEEGYDGSGASVLAEFLEAKSGYCVHFSSAMASMARTLGIPARVAVGFTPGDSTLKDDETEYRVTTDDFHAWPELYFAGIGWVRFEPTPTRGEVPAFAPASVDDPATPDVDESEPVPATTPDPSAAPTRNPDDEPSPTPSAAAGGGASSGPQWWSYSLVFVVLIALAPLAVRVIRRRRRLALVADGSALAGWDEIRDTADDLGMKTSDSRTPRQLSQDLDARLTDDGARALAALRTALESEAYDERGGDPDPADVRAVLRALRRGSRPGARIAARLLPLSLFAKWLPAPSTIEEPG